MFLVDFCYSNEEQTTYHATCCEQFVDSNLCPFIVLSGSCLSKSCCIDARIHGHAQDCSDSRVSLHRSPCHLTVMHKRQHRARSRDDLHHVAVSDVLAQLGRGRSKAAAAHPSKASHRPVAPTRSFSPATPPVRSPSVDSQADVLPTLRQAAVRRAGQIIDHWSRGRPGRAPLCSSTSMGPADFAAMSRRLGGSRRGSSFAFLSSGALPSSSSSDSDEEKGGEGSTCAGEGKGETGDQQDDASMASVETCGQQEATSASAECQHEFRGQHSCSVQHGHRDAQRLRGQPGPAAGEAGVASEGASSDEPVLISSRVQKRKRRK